MRTARLALAQDRGVLPPTLGDCVVFGAMEPADFDGLSYAGLTCVTSSFVRTNRLRAAGMNVLRDPIGSFDTAIVRAARSKDETRHALSWAVQHTRAGMICLDGQKTDGIDSHIKAIKALGISVNIFAKAHGKTAAFPAHDAQALRDWSVPARLLDGGFRTAPGVFSADGPDPASQLLVAHLPQELHGNVADLGAGWGFLSVHVAERMSAGADLHLVEDNADALDCARAHPALVQAKFHWDDATHWLPPRPLDAVVMNPPFHIGRMPDPALGQAFIRAAAACLKPGGALWMVANAHLPYDQVLAERFSDIEDVARTKQFRVIHARAKRSR